MTFFFLPFHLNFLAGCIQEEILRCFVASVAGGELEEFVALEALASLGGSSTNGGQGGVPRAVATLMGDNPAHGWKVLGAYAALVTCLPLGSSLLDAALDAFAAVPAAGGGSVLLAAFTEYVTAAASPFSSCSFFLSLLGTYD